MYMNRGAFQTFFGNRRSDLHLRVFAALVQQCEMKQPSQPSGIQLRREPSVLAGYGIFWSRAHVFKELEFVARSLPRLERRTFSRLELAS